jgi:Tol biopolymer transport system component
VSTPRRRMLAAASITLAILLGTTGSAVATFPGPNGRITFMRFDTDGQFQVWAANPDLSHQVQLTSGPSDAWFPAWSPDGRRIAFASHRSDPDPTDDVEVMDVFTMRGDGSDVRKVTDSKGFSGTPSWSPDGRWIVFSADRADYPRGQGIYITRSDGSTTPRRLTTLPATSGWQELARFSPDGSRIVFTEYRTVAVPDEAGGTVDVEQSALFTVRLDGSKLRRITAWGLSASDADWSPDGRRLVFGTRPPWAGGLQEVMIADGDGEHLRNLSHDHPMFPPASPEDDYRESFNPAWSPDGRVIVFVHASYTPAEGFQMGLQLIRPDGSHRTWLSLGEEHQPDWGSARPVR